MKRKYFVIILAVLTVFLFAGCNGGNSGGDADADSAAKDTLSGSVSDILADVLANVDVELPMTFDSAITAEDSQGMIGLSPDQFGQYVSEASVSTAAISTFAFQVAIVKCNDIAGATEVKGLIAKGFDSAKWICVMPEQSMAVESGSYVLLAVGPTDSVNAILKSFTDAAAGNVGSPNIFFSAS